MGPSARLRRFAPALIAAFVLGACGSDDPAPEPAESAVVDPSVARLVDRTMPAGASGSLVAARDGEIVHCDGFGLSDREVEIAAGCDTVYDIQSMTKQFTAAAIVKLEEMGELRVSDPISRHLGPVPPDKQGITLHHLLTHTAGLPAALGGDYAPLSRAEMVAGALESKLRSEPGAEYHYSNVGYSLLAAIVEDASGMSYERFLAAELFAPAGMTETGYVLPEWEPDRVAVEYDARGESQGRPFERRWAEDGPYWNLRGNGGLLSTPRDMFRWHLALAGDEVLGREAKAKLFEPYVLEFESGDSYYGYGWVVQRSDDYGRFAWHDGGNAWSFGMITRLLDEDVMVFWITNAYRDAEAGWNLSRLEPALTTGVVDRVRDRAS